MWDATIRSRCPGCGEGELFAGPWAVRPLCPTCAVRFERDDGSWTGPVVLAYAAAAVAALGGGLALYAVAGFFRGYEVAVAAIAAAAALAAYRPAKGWWVWLLWATGLVVTDERFRRESRPAGGPERPPPGRTPPPRR